MQDRNELKPTNSTCIGSGLNVYKGNPNDGITIIDHIDESVEGMYAWIIVNYYLNTARLRCRQYFCI